MVCSASRYDHLGTLDQLSLDSLDISSYFIDLSIAWRQHGRASSRAKATGRDQGREVRPASCCSIPESVARQIVDPLSAPRPSIPLALQLAPRRKGAIDGTASPTHGKVNRICWFVNNVHIFNSHVTVGRSQPSSSHRLRRRTPRPSAKVLLRRNTPADSGHHSL